MSSQSITFSCAPCCSPGQVDQTDGLFGVKILGIVLGIISLLVGILILSKIPGLSALGTTGGSVFIGCGVLLMAVGCCLNCGPKKLPGFREQVREDYLARQQSLLDMEFSTLEQLRQLQTPDSRTKEIPPSFAATFNNLLADASTLDTSGHNTLPNPPIQNDQAPTLRAPTLEDLATAARVLRVGELTNQLIEAVKAGQSTTAIENQLINEGIDADALAQKIARIKSSN